MTSHSADQREHRSHDSQSADERRKVLIMTSHVLDEILALNRYLYIEAEIPALSLLHVTVAAVSQILY